MTTYCFIFARGGSKGLPRKNIKKLNGKPLIEYSIHLALSSSLIDRVFVSTEDEEIADVAKRSGATIIDRPTELASDSSPEWLSWRHAIDWVVNKYGKFDGFVSLPATSPLRSLEDVENAIMKRETTKADICISITPASRNPFFNMVKASSDGFVELVNKLEIGVDRRQDAPQVFDITTVVYATTADFVMENESVFDGIVTSVVVPKERAIDIDDIYDFKLAEVICIERENEC